MHRSAPRVRSVPGPARRSVARLAALLALAVPAAPGHAQSADTAALRWGQAIDQEYTRLIAQHLQDERITTELVDHLPASDEVPTPLDFHGRIVGTPGEITYAADIHRYLRAIADASPRATVWSMGLTEEGREMVVMAIADEETIANLEAYGGYLQELTDPRVTSEARARELIGEVAKPIYWLTSGIHSTELGGPEMLQELAYRLVVQESPFIRDIRENVITFITPVIEPDGREKQVDRYYFNKERPEGEAQLPLMYWGRYVAHDNNRDAMGQMLALTQHVNRTFLEWTPTILHDLHESSTYLYVSTGTGPYNEAFDAITIGEWWVLAENDVLELTKRDVPGVWTYNFYDGWTPNYMFTVAHAHNAIGRFYEVHSYGPDNRTSRANATTTSREWYRPNPPDAEIRWGPRNNTNIQQSGVLFSLKYVAEHRDWFLENYWLKNRRAVRAGETGPVHGWVIPAGQRRKADAAQAVNDLRAQGLEFHRATDDFEAGGVRVAEGDWIVRGDQPYRTLAEMYFSLQAFSLDNPRPYDDTGWTFQLMRNLELHAVEDPALLEADMEPVTGPVRARGGVVAGRGDVLVVEHTTDNALVTFRFRHADVGMWAAEEDFRMEGRTFRAGAFLIPEAEVGPRRAELEASLAELGLSGYAARNLPDVPAHELDVPRIGYIHAWQRTQDEGWVRGALDYYGVPYDYFADQVARQGGLREQYDVIIYPHVGGSAQAQVEGIAMTGELPLPYRRTERFPNQGGIDESDDIRGGMGFEGLVALAEFVREGGTLIVEGATAAIFPEYGITPDVRVERPEGLVAPGSVHRGVITDPTSPLVYGYPGPQMPVFFKGDVVLAAGRGGGGGFGRGGGPWQNTTPMARRPELSPYPGEPAEAGDTEEDAGAERDADALAPFRAQARALGFGTDGDDGPRVVLAFPDDPGHMLLSGALGGGRALAGRAQVVDTPVGDGHVVSFAIRPFWRWQTQGNYFLGFNAILNWNDLDAGRAAEPETNGGG
ncbi:MAG: M14 family zinc carboxypeptidase [Longimicrobiales bacterium]|nr:M14 family zinc carboxypeptidase [Longimicrobiales bacterium]